jgi:ABC-2 type transport system permease protein
VHSLPAVWQRVSHLNPLFYLVDGFRCGFFGASDVSPWWSLGVALASLLLASVVSIHLLRIGYKIRH